MDWCGCMRACVNVYVCVLCVCCVCVVCAWQARYLLAGVDQRDRRGIDVQA